MNQEEVVETLTHDLSWMLVRDQAPHELGSFERQRDAWLDGEDLLSVREDGDEALGFGEVAAVYTLTAAALGLMAPVCSYLLGLLGQQVAGELSKTAATELIERIKRWWGAEDDDLFTAEQKVQMVNDLPALVKKECRRLNIPDAASAQLSLALLQQLHRRKKA